jgi:small-conductance mechanosensitive channel
MRSYSTPLRYILAVIVAILVLIVIDTITFESIPVLANIGNTLLIILLIILLYSIGVAIIVRGIQEETSRLAAVKIFTVILAGITLLLAMVIWIGDLGQVMITLGILWGAVFIALRDFIQNLVGSLVLLTTRMYRIGDRIRLRGNYGLVMDIGVFRTTLMELDREAGDRPTGEILTVPNGILFREVVTNTTKHISVVSDEIRITLPFTADLEQARTTLIETVNRHTGEIKERADLEFRQLGEKKYLPGFETSPTINLQLSDRGIVLILKYITVSQDRSSIKTRIVEEFSRQIPGIMEIHR